MKIKELNKLSKGATVNALPMMSVNVGSSDLFFIVEITPQMPASFLANPDLATLIANKRNFGNPKTLAQIRLTKQKNNNSCYEIVEYAYEKTLSRTIINKFLDDFFTYIKSRTQFSIAIRFDDLSKFTNTAFYLSFKKHF